LRHAALCSRNRAKPAANARPFLEKARGAARATPREQRYIAAVEAWANGDIARAIALHAEQAREHPRDLVSVKLGQYHCFNTGDCPGMLRLALAALPAAADVPYVHGMTAFGYEQCHLMRDAEASARHAIGDVPQGTLGPPRTRACDAHRRPPRRGAGVHAQRERHLERAQLLHGHAQLVARGACS
jgi:hypothetical protein